MTTIIIVGGGLSGRSIAVQQAWHYAALKKEQPDLPPLHIRLIDGGGGAGPAYDTRDDVFLLNQPANAMSPFPQDPDHFTRWLGGTGHEFATRARYGDYLRQIITDAFDKIAQNGVPVTCEIIRENVSALALGANAATVFTAKGGQESDALVLATGHARGKFLQEFEGAPGFFSAAYTSADVKQALEKDTHGAVAIIGSGACALDALGALDRTGYKGDIYVISRHLVRPWAYNPEKYGDGRPAYQPHFLDPDYVRAHEVRSGAALKKCLEQEFIHAEKQGYDIGHVLTAIDFKALAAAAPGGVDELRELWAHHYGNPAPPERKKLYDDYVARGQLHLVQGDVQACNIKAIDGGFKIGGIHVSALFNCAGVFARDPLASPLLLFAEKEGALKHAFNCAADTNGRNAAVAPGRQNHPLLFVAGPAVSPDKWGVETFRDNNLEVAKLSVEQALHLAPTQPKGNQNVR